MRLPRLLLSGLIAASVLLGMGSVLAAAQRAPTTDYDVNVFYDAEDMQIDGTCDSDPSAGDQCTLRAAVQEANADPNYDLIGLPGGTYSITGEAIAISNTSLEIRGAFNGSTWIDGRGASSGSLFVQHGATVTTTRINFQNGAGGQLTNHGVLRMQDCIVSGGRNSSNGGGIVNAHHLTVENCQLTDNRAGQVGGAIYSQGYDYPSTLTVRDTIFYGNMSGGSGGAISLAESEAWLENVTLQRNVAWGTPASNAYGGALSIKSSSDPFTVTVDSSVFADNYSTASGGAIFSSNRLVVADTEFRYNRAAQLGGAIFSQSRPVEIVRSGLWGNRAEYDGGAIFRNTNDLTLSQSAIYGNSARDGGGLATSDFGGTITLENVTLSGNEARRDGGGLFAKVGTTTLSYSTVTGNSAAGAGGGVAGEGSVTLHSSILAENAAASGQDCSGSGLSSGGYNVVGNDDGCGFAPAAGDQVGTAASPLDPLLGPLQLNGGPIEWPTHALLSSSSPAYDAGDGAGCPPADQRGVVRPYAGSCDSGAFELDPGISAPAPTPPPTPAPLWPLTTYPDPVPGQTFIVDDAGSGDDWDPGDGTCGIYSNGGPCTLPAAVAESNALPGQDRIELGSGTFANHYLEVTDHLIISGQSMTDTILDGGRIDSDYSTIVQIGNVTMQNGQRFLNPHGRLFVHDCKLQGNADSAIFAFYGYADALPLDHPLPEVEVRRCLFQDNQGAFNGGAIYAEGTVHIFDSTFRRNGATHGGAIYHLGSVGVYPGDELIIENSTFVDNWAEDYGGALRARWARATIKNTRFHGNYVSGTGESVQQGGAINATALMTVENSTFDHNQTYYAGGALANGGKWNLDVDPAVLTVRNSTFYSNSSTNYGGGIVYEGIGTFANTTFSQNRADRNGGGLLVAAQSQATITNSTFTGNVADADADGDGDGGGLLVTAGLFSDAGNASLANTIIAGNSLGSGGEGRDCDIPAGHGFSMGHNLIGATEGCQVAWAGDDLTGTAALPLAPQLTELITGTGLVPVHRPLATSPALEGGDDALCPATDARGQARPADGDENGPATCDIGAVEISPKGFYVNNAGSTGDAAVGDGVCYSHGGGCTFVAAVEEANAWDLHDTVFLGRGSFASPNVTIGQEVTIVGQGALESVLDGGSSERILQIGNVWSGLFPVELHDLALTNGAAGSSSGGAIYNAANLTLKRGLVSNNQAQYGGGILNAGILLVEDSAIVSNTASYRPRGGTTSGWGGGIYNNSGSSAVIRNSTLSTNGAYNTGGGIYHGGNGTLTLVHVTIANNVASTGEGGGFYGEPTAGGAKVINSLLGANSAGGSNPDCYGTLLQGSPTNLVENITISCDYVGNSGNPDLGPLADNGGDTLTHALGSRSQARDVAYLRSCLDIDQRGFNRDAASCDLGAFELDAVCEAPAISSLSPLLQADDLLLTWADDGQAYEVWWHDSLPYFSPGSFCAPAGNCNPTETAAYIDYNPLGSTESRYYAVRSVAACGDVSQVDRVGIFSFGLAPGE